MEKKSIRLIWWTITIVYLLFTYATLGVMPAIWNSLNSLTGGNGATVLFIIYAFTGIVILFYIVFIKKEISIKRYLLFFVFIIIFIIMYKFEKLPGEKIHMAQYGVFGILLYNALKIDLDKFSIKLYIYGALICLLAGAIDEVIQLILPNRYFT